MKYKISLALTRCHDTYRRLCLMTDKYKAERLFITEGLVPLMNETIASIQRHEDLFENKLALQMIVSIFEDIKGEIYSRYDSSDTTVLAAGNLVDIAVKEEGYKNILREVLAYLYEYGFYAVGEDAVISHQEKCKYDKKEQ